VFHTDDDTQVQSTIQAVLDVKQENYGMFLGFFCIKIILHYVKLVFLGICSNLSSFQPNVALKPCNACTGHPHFWP